MRVIKGLDHIGIAVKNLDEALEIYEGILGLEVENSTRGFSV